MVSSMLGRCVARAILVAVLALSGGVAALADRIDGEWCREDSHFIIDGPRILTHGGTATTGEYSRHGFRYTAPATDADSGSEIEMHLHSETTLELFRRAPGTPPITGPGQIWNRCRVTS